MTIHELIQLPNNRSLEQKTDTDTYSVCLKEVPQGRNVAVYMMIVLCIEDV